MGAGRVDVAQETYAYAKTLLDVATSSADGQTRALLVGGGIANFTDVAATFKGIIQVRTAPQPLSSTAFCATSLGAYCRSHFRCTFCVVRWVNFVDEVPEKIFYSCGEH